MLPSVGLPIRNWRDNSCRNPLSVGSIVRPSSKSTVRFLLRQIAANSEIRADLPMPEMP